MVDSTRSDRQIHCILVDEMISRRAKSDRLVTSEGKSPWEAEIVDHKFLAAEIRLEFPILYPLYNNKYLKCGRKLVFLPFCLQIINN